MRKYAKMLAVTGGLAAATTACGAPPPESAAPTCETVACAVAGCCGVCETCGACEVRTGCDAGGTCDARTGCGSCGTCGVCEVRTAAVCVAAVCEPSPPIAAPCETRPDLDIPAYPTWPPETPSSSISIDYLIEDREGLSLYDAGQRLRTSLREADYGQHSFYSVPGGFILVTVTEQIDTQGKTLPAEQRYLDPGEGREASLLLRIRDLFFERPDAFYRYIAIVVSDRGISTSDEALTSDEARRRVSGGISNLGADARDIAFDESFNVTALIYEYVNEGVGTELKMIDPRRLDAALHLDRTGLVQTVPDAFARAAE